MSVAFRRESDEEHLEPKFEIPLPPGPNLVTARGLALIHAKVAALEAELLALTDEAERKRAERALRYWHTRAATAQLVEPPTGDRVEFGCVVRFRLDGKERSMTIVGDDEADPAASLISFSAPLARAMMEGEVGDVLPFQGREDAIEIVAIAPIAA
jgi:transcription elongation GreA/GreB family factor